MDLVKHMPVSFIGVLGIWLSIAGCASVDTLRLTNQSFPPKASTQEVELLDQEPKCPHLAIAQLSIDDSEYDSFEKEQRKILEKAASLGADAVVFSKPKKQVKHSVAYGGPMWGPWGMGGYGYPGWGYGWGYGGGYGGGMAFPYDYTVKSLKGIAIRFTDASGPKC